MARVKLDSSAGTGLYIEYSISAPDYVNARYTLTMSLQAVKLSSSYGTWKASTPMSLSGFGSWSTSYNQSSWSVGSYHTLKSVSVYVGFGKSYTMSGKLDLSGTTAGTLSGSYKVTMSNPNRKSTLSGLPSKVALGDSCAFTLTEAAAALKTDITYSVGDATGTILSDAAAGSKKWTVPTSLATQFETHEISCTITVKTYSGATLIGANTYTVTLEFIPCYVHDGTEWHQAIPYVYDGSTWKEAIPYIHNGSEWAA